MGSGSLNTFIGCLITWSVRLSYTSMCSRDRSTIALVLTNQSFPSITLYVVASETCKLIFVVQSPSNEIGTSLIIPNARFFLPLTSMRSTFEGSSMTRPVDSRNSLVIMDVAAPVSGIAFTLIPNISISIEAQSVNFGGFVSVDFIVSSTPAEDTATLLNFLRVQSWFPRTVRSGP